MTRRLLVSHLMIALLVLVALEVPLGIAHARGESARFTAAVERDAVVLAERAADSIADGEIGSIPGALVRYTRDTGGRAVAVDARGVLLADSAQAGTAPPIGREILEALDGRRSTGIRSVPGYADELYVAVPARTGSDVRGALRVSYPSSVVEARGQRLWLVLLLAGLAVLAAAAVAALVAARRLSRPVQALECATAQLAAGVLPDPPASGPDFPELQRVTATLQHTARRLQLLTQAKQTFAADAAHQLATPLAALRLRLENLESAVDPRAHASLDAAVADTERLTRMVDGLLTLARLEDSAGGSVPIDLDAVVTDRVASWTPSAAELDVALLVTGEDVGSVRAVPGALQQILDNLLANALRAAPPHSTITVDRRPDPARPDECVELHVIDQGPGLRPADRERAFERFWRGPGAREEGTGLGLTVVAQLARAGGGRAELREAAGGGIDAVVGLRSVAVPEPSRPKDRTPHRGPVRRPVRAGKRGRAGYAAAGRQLS